MFPTLKPSTHVLISYIPYLFRKPKIGDIIVFQKNHMRLIKRIRKMLEVRYYVVGDNEKHSTKVWIEKKDILGKVIYSSF